MCMHVYIVFCRFNMPHDDSNKCKEDGVKIQQHVMAPTLNYYTNPWMWSKCSRKYITEFLEYVLQIIVASCDFHAVVSSYSVRKWWDMFKRWFNAHFKSNLFHQVSSISSSPPNLWINLHSVPSTHTHGIFFVLFFSCLFCFLLEVVFFIISY